MAMFVIKSFHVQINGQVMDQLTDTRPQEELLKVCLDTALCRL